MTNVAVVPVTPAERADEFTVHLTLRDGYAFDVDFGDGIPPMISDEPPPLGVGRGPNPARLLGSALASCLGSSLLHCLRKARVDVPDLRVRVDGTFTRNQRGRLRIEQMRVRLEPSIATGQMPRIERCLELFEEFCIVTESVRHGIDVRVDVVPSLASAPEQASQ